MASSSPFPVVHKAASYFMATTLWVMEYTRARPWKGILGIFTLLVGNSYKSEAVALVELRKRKDRLRKVQEGRVEQGLKATE